MDKYDDLEMVVLNCFLINPELMENTILEDKHFKKNKRMWKFMKSFYNKFKTFDMHLMASVCKDRYQIVEYVSLLLEYDPDYKNFELYQNRLIEMYEESEKDDWIIERVFKNANDLYVRKISIDEFNEKNKKIYDDAEKIFEKSVNK